MELLLCNLIIVAYGSLGSLTHNYITTTNSLEKNYKVWIILIVFPWIIPHCLSLQALAQFPQFSANKEKAA
ncbi:hypothetical protein V1520DRAFT_348263 [Lipomyces starkeyi]